METHPVPQNISSYEFRLVGDMTLKQFLQLAAGGVVALLIFRLPLIGIIKYPLTFISALLGILMAFVPINGRPFSTWFFAFIKAVYSPTEYVWEPIAEPAVLPQVVQAPPTVPPSATPAPVVTSFSSLITSKLSNIVPPAPSEARQSEVGAQTTATTITITPDKTPPAPTPAPVKTPAPQSQVAPQIVPPPLPSLSAEAMTKAAPAPATSPPQSVTPPPSPQSASINTAPVAVPTSLISPPTSPNVLAGLVTNLAGQPLNGITVEIIDTGTGIPARALRTNRLGQFQIAIPLAPGTYNIIAEKEGLTFAPVSIQVKGRIIPPIVISAKT